MRALLSAILLCLLLLCPLSARAQSPTAMPDYGAKQGVADTTATAATAALPAMNPLQQAGRAVVALVIVLAGVVGVVLLLKKLGLGQNGTLSVSAFAQSIASRAAPGEAAAGPQIVALRSQTLPGGATLHLVAVGDRTLLLAATPQSVSLLTEWEDEPAAAIAAIPTAPSEHATPEKAAFAALLEKVAGASAPVSEPSPPPAPVISTTGSLSETAQRLRARLAQSQSIPQESL